MSDGTKIGQVQDAEAFEPEFNEEGEALEATKIGEVSAFEKELLDDDIIEEKKEEPIAEVASPEATEDSGKSELERFLDEESAEMFEYEEGDVIQGIVRSVEKGGTLIDFNFKSDGFVHNTELGYDDENQVEKLEAGQELDFYIEKLESKEGYAILSRKKAQLEQSWDELFHAYKERTTVNVSVQSKVQGGLVSSYKAIKGFIPASQVLKEKEDDLEVFINTVMEVSVLQVDRRRRKVIFSHKASKSNFKQGMSKLLEELEVGQTREGKVTSIKDFGVFVDLGGVEGLVHISELSWSRVSHPSDYVDVGEDVSVFILGVDKENKKISLGMKQLEPDPWVEVSSNYHVGKVIEGEITRTTPFGAFIRFEENLEGLIHISELSHDRVEKVDDIVKSGDIVKAKIIKLVAEEQKIGLTLKNLDETPAEPEPVAETPAEEPAEDIAQEVSSEPEVSEDAPVIAAEEKTEEASPEESSPA